MATSTAGGTVNVYAIPDRMGVTPVVRRVRPAGVIAPFKDIAVHIEQTRRIRRLLSDRVRLAIKSFS